MQDVVAQLISHFFGIWRHRWVAMGMAWIIALGGWAYVWKLPESYVASARVYVDTNSVLRPLLRGLTISPDINQRIAMLSQTLLSRPNLQQLARMTDLDLQATTDASKERLILRLEDSISLEGTRGNASLYTISVTDPDRETARRIAQALITVFIESSMSDKRQDSSGAQSFLQNQLAESEQRLIEAENRLALFKQRNVDVLPGERGGYYSRLQEAQGAVRQAQLQLREVENRRNELQRQIAGELPLDDVRLPIDERIQALFVQIDGLLTRYTARHPEVERLQALIAELEAQREVEMQRLRSQSGQGSAALANSPIYQGMRTMLASTEAQAAELRVRVAEYRDRMEDLAGKVNVIPTIEAELIQLNRDYNVIAEQHQQLLKRRESARLAGDVESSAGDVSFRVIDPPFVPSEPSHPNKLLFNGAVLVLALGGGIATALLLALVSPVVTDARMLAASTGLPLLGTVSWNMAGPERRAKSWRFAAFLMCCGALLLAYAGTVVVPPLLA